MLKNGLSATFSDISFLLSADNESHLIGEAQLLVKVLCSTDHLLECLPSQQENLRQQAKQRKANSILLHDIVHAVNFMSPKDKDIESGGSDAKQSTGWQFWASLNSFKHSKQFPSAVWR